MAKATPAPPPRAPSSVRGLGLLALAGALTIPALVVRFTVFRGETPPDTPPLDPIMGMVVFGIGIVSAAFILTWAAEVAELDIGSGLAIVFLALVTVLPEYAVDLYFAWTAATEPDHLGFALANMTGANRLLIGIGWPVVALMAWFRFGRSEIVLRRDSSSDVVWLGIPTIYTMLVPLKGSLAWYDALILFGCYAMYVKASKNEPEEHADLVGPPVVMGAWPPRRRRAWTVGLFVWAAFVILASSEPFAESLVHGGERLGIDEYLLVQWLAPLASESPEFVVVILLTLRGKAALGLGAFLSSKINQWTLLVGGVPLAYAAAHWHADLPIAWAMPIEGRQVEELWLTATQGLYATAVLADLRFTLRQALTILGLFLIQFVGSIVMEASGHHGAIGPFHLALAVLYVVLAIERFVTQRREVMQRLREAFSPGQHAT